MRDVRENHGLEISAKARRRFADTFFASLSRLVVFVDGGKDDSLVIIPEFIAENIKSPQMFRVLIDSYF